MEDVWCRARSRGQAHTPALPSRPQVFSLQDLAGDILTVMRLRLKRFLSFLESSPRGVASRGLLASLDADTCQWVRSARDTEAAAARGAGGGGAGGVQSKKEAGEPLRSTHGVLLCLARALPRESRHKVGCYSCYELNERLVAVKGLVSLLWLFFSDFSGGMDFFVGYSVLYLIRERCGISLFLYTYIRAPGITFTKSTGIC